MSFIESQTDPTTLASFDGASVVAAALDVANNVRAGVAGGTSLTAGLATLAPLGNAVFAGGSGLSSFLRIGGEANVFLDAAFAGAGALGAALRNTIDPFARVECGTQFGADLSVSQAERADLIIFADIVPAVSAGTNIQILGARLKMDGVEKPIKSFRFSAPSGAAGVRLDAQFSRPTPSDVPVGSGSTFTFDIYFGGAWATILTGIFGSRSHAIEFSGDTLSISTIDNASDKLAKAPKFPQVFYDPAKNGTLTEEKSDILRDTFGNEYPTTFTSSAGLDLYGLLQWAFVTVCGFTAYRTNLPNFPILRADFPMGRPVRETIAGLTGMFEPLFFEVNGEIWIVDATLALPAGLVPRTCPASRFRSFSAETGPDAGNLDGLVVTYTESGDGDFYTQRFETEETAVAKSGYAATTTTVEREFWEYRNSSDPQTILRSLLKSETRTTENVLGTTIGRETLHFDVDSRGRVTGHTKKIEGLIPTLVVDSDELQFGLVSEELQQLRYTTNSAGQTWLSKRETVARGLVATDTDNLYLEQFFKQDFIEAHRAGNLRVGMTVTTQATRSVIESFRLLANGQTSVNTTTIDHLRGTLTASRTENESGESEISGRQKTRRLIVWREGYDLYSSDLSQRQLKDLNIGELPIAHGKSLAQRKLLRTNAGKGTAEVSLFGYDAGLRRGSTMRITDRSGASLGDFLTLGFEISGDGLGTAAATLRTRLELLEL